jgi:transcription-repair coupling factor (superfamily II helicase)
LIRAIQQLSVLCAFFVRRFIGDRISIGFINEVLFEYEFKIDFITEPGEFSSWRYRRCVFFSNDNPYRISFGTKLKSIRSLVATVVYRNPKENSIIPNENKVFQENRKFPGLYFRENGYLFKIPKTFLQVGQAICEGRRSFEKLSTDIKHAAGSTVF